MASGEGPGWGWIPQVGSPGGGPPASGPPAGWLPDPSGRFELRYWSGERWTPRVRVGRAEAIDREGVASDAATQTGDSGVAGSWYPDPTGRFEQRLLVGERWTRHVRLGEAVAVDTLSVPNNVRLPKDVRRGRAGTSTSPPGWSPDPADSSTERYWDGVQWTAARRPRGSGGPAQRSVSLVPRRVMATGILIVAIMLALLVAFVLWLLGVLG